MNRIRRRPSPLQKKARKSFQGYPVATIAYYGPDDRHATKVAVGIVKEEDGGSRYSAALVFRGRRGHT